MIECWTFCVNRTEQWVLQYLFMSVKDFLLFFQILSLEDCVSYKWHIVGFPFSFFYPKWWSFSFKDEIIEFVFFISYLLPSNKLRSKWFKTITMNTIYNFCELEIWTTLKEVFLIALYCTHKIRWCFIYLTSLGILRLNNLSLILIVSLIHQDILGISACKISWGPGSALEHYFCHIP